MSPIYSAPSTPRITEFLWAGIFCGLLAAYMGGCTSTLIDPEPPEVCTTDSDCMKHCPPPADDPDCDGGPQ